MLDSDSPSLNPRGGQLLHRKHSRSDNMRTHCGTRTAGHFTRGLDGDRFFAEGLDEAGVNGLTLGTPASPRPAIAGRPVACRNPRLPLPPSASQQQKRPRELEPGICPAGYDHCQTRFGFATRRQPRLRVDGPRRWRSQRPSMAGSGIRGCLQRVQGFLNTGTSTVVG